MGLGLVQSQTFKFVLKVVATSVVACRLCRCVQEILLIDSKTKTRNVITTSILILNIMINKCLCIKSVSFGYNSWNIHELIIRFGLVFKLCLRLLGSIERRVLHDES